MSPPVEASRAYGSAYWRLPPAVTPRPIADDPAHVAAELAVGPADANGRNGEPVAHAWNHSTAGV